MSHHKQEFICKKKPEMDPRCMLLGAHWSVNHEDHDTIYSQDAVFSFDYDHLMVF